MKSAGLRRGICKLEALDGAANVKDCSDTWHQAISLLIT